MRSHIDAVWLFRTGTMVAGTGFAASIVIDHPIAGFVGLIALGTGLSFTLPLTLSAAANLPATSPATVVARVSTLAYLGSFAGPALIGGLAHYVGLAAALLLPALLVTAPEPSCSHVPSRPSAGIHSCGTIHSPRLTAFWW